MDWFLNLRKIALAGFVAGVLSMPYPVWSALQRVRIAGSYPDSWREWASLAWIPAIVLFLTILPLAYLWLLYRNQSPLDVPMSGRHVAKAAALAFLIFEIKEIIPLFHSSGLSKLTWQVAADYLSTLAGFGFNFSLILILAVLARPGEPLAPSEPEPSSAFRKWTRVALITGYVLLGYQVCRIAYIPVMISMVRSAGRTTPTAMDLLLDILTALWLTACMTAIPFVVSRSLPKPETAREIEDGLVEAENDEGVPGG